MIDENGKMSKTMVEHTNKSGDYNNYVQIFVIKSEKPIYRYADTLEQVSEQDLETIKELLTKRTSNAAHQGLSEDKEIIIRDYKVQSVLGLRLNKTEFVIKADAVKGDIQSTVSAQTV